MAATPPPAETASGSAPPAQAPRRRRGPLGVLVRIALWLVAIVVALVLVAFILLQTELGRGWLKDAVLSVLNDGFQGHFSCERIGGFLPFDATVEGFAVTDPEGQPALAVPKLTADFHPLELLDRKVHLSNIHVTGPVVSLFDARRQVPIARAFTPKVPPTPGEAPPWEVILEGIELDAGELRGLVPGEDLGLERLSVDLTLGVGPRGPAWHDVEVRATATGGSALALATRGGPVVVRTSGGLSHDTLTFDRLALTAGPHEVVASASLYLPDLAAPPEEVEPAGSAPKPAAPTPPAATPTSTPPPTPTAPTPPSHVEVASLHIDLDALPPALRDLFGRGVIEGSGEGQIIGGEADLHAALSTPVGFVGVQVGGTVRPTLGEWAGSVWVFDAVIPPGLRDRLPPELQVTRLDAALDIHGRSLPTARRSDLVIDGDLWQRAPTDSGHVSIEVARLHKQGGMRAAPSFSWRIVGDAFDIEPWLGVAGQPELAGELHGLWAEGRLTLPTPDRPALFSAIVDLDGALAGRLRAGDAAQPLALTDLDLLTTIMWEGQASPVGHVELRAGPARFEAAEVAALGASIELELDRDGRPRARGEVRATALVRGDVRAAEVAAPYDLTLVDGLPEGELGLRLVHARAAGHAVERARVALRLAREGPGLRVHGPLELAGLAVALGPGAAPATVRAGTLALDWRLASRDPIDPMGAPSRATVNGTLEGAALGPRAAASLAVDLRLGADDGLAGALAVGGTVKARGLSTPEATAGTADVGVDLTVVAGAVRGQARVDATDAVVRALPPDGGRRFDTLHVEARTVASADRPGAQAFEITGDALEKGLLETRFTAHVTPPTGRQPLLATLDELRMKRAVAAGGRRDPSDLVVIQGARLDATGWFELGTIHVGTAATGSVTVSGRLHPGEGALELEASGGPLRLSDWLGHLTRLTRLTFPRLPDVDGVLAFELSAQGTVSDPRFTTRLKLSDLRIGARSGGAFDLDASLSAALVEGRCAVRWSSDGHLEASLHLPLSAAARAPPGPASPPLASLPEAPAADPLALFGRRLNETAPWSMRLDAAIPDARAALAWGEAAAGQPLAPELRGQATIAAELGGTGLAPTLRLDVDPLALAGWSGAIHARAPAEPRSPRDTYALEPGDVRVPLPPPPTDAELFGLDLSIAARVPPKGAASRAKPAATSTEAAPSEVLGLFVGLPRDVFQAAWSPERGAVERLLGQRDLLVRLLAPDHALADLPGVALVPDFRYPRVRARADVEVRGRYPKLVADGLVHLAALDQLGLTGGLDVRLGMSGDRLLAMVEASSSELALGGAQLVVPRFGELIGHPSRFRSVLEDPDFRVEVDTVALRTADLINLDPGLGQTLEMLFPYSIAAAHVVARGQKGGPEVSVTASVFADAPVTADGVQSVEPEASGASGTSLAEQAYVNIQVKRVETEVRVSLLPDSKAGAGLSLSARADIGTTALLSGHPPELGSVPITANLVAESFELDGLTNAVQSILGGTSGFLTGQLEVDGTLGEPRFHGTPGLVLEPLAIPRIGFEQPVSIFLSFEGSTIRLQDPLVLEVPGDEPQSLRLDFAADIPSFDPKRVRLDGAVELVRYPVLATDAMKVRATGKLALSGTAARPAVAGKIAVVDGVVAPDIAQREVRAMGLPADVHFVRGEPRPPPATTKRVVSRKTELQLDIALEIPKGSVRVEPHIVQPIGEVRALLWPHGSLQVRTVQREIGIFGTIYVPKENVYLYGKKFVVDPDSRLVFTGDMETDPQLYLTARYDISHVDLTPIGLVTTPDSTAVVRVTGSPSTALHIDFSSDPPMDEANILSVIALDQPAGGGTQGLADALTTQVAGAVLGMATLELTRELVKKLPIDILRVESTSSTLDQARITVGKQIGPRIVLNTSFNVNAKEGESHYDFSAEYKLSRVFSVIGKWGDIGEYSLEATLRLQP